MEEGKLEPAVLAAEHYIAEEGHRRRALTLWLGVFLSAIAGGAIVLAVVLGAPQFFLKPQEKLVVVPNQQRVSTVTPPVPEGKPLPANTPKNQTPVSPPANSSKTVGSRAMPSNPFTGANLQTRPIEGEIQKGDPPAPLSGNLGPYAPVQPPNPPPKGTSQSSGSSTLLIARSTGGDAESEGDQIAQALRSAGASVRVAPHYNLAGGVVGVQIVATIPQSSLSGAAAKLNSAGARTSDRWEGSPDQRGDRVASMIATRISELRRIESELKEKYEEDASEIVAVREEIQKLNQCMSAAKGVGRSAGVAIILVSVGSL